MQSTFRERRFMIHLKYFLQIYPPKNWWIQIKKYLCTRCSAASWFPQNIWFFLRMAYIEILEDETKIGGSQNLRVAYKLYIFVMK